MVGPADYRVATDPSLRYMHPPYLISDGSDDLRLYAPRCRRCDRFLDLDARPDRRYCSTRCRRSAAVDRENARADTSPLTPERRRAILDECWRAHAAAVAAIERSAA